MFTKSRIIRLALWACMAATWLPIGNGLLQPAQAKAWEVVRGGAIVRGGPVVVAGPVVRSGPVVVGGPIVVARPVVVGAPIVVARPIIYRP